MKSLLARYICALRRYAVLTGILLAAGLACGITAQRGQEKWGGAIEQRESRGRVVRPVDCMRTGLWQAAVLNGALFLALALTTPLWARRGPVDGEAGAAPDGHTPWTRPAPERAMGPVVFWLGLLLILALGFLLRAPRMHLSIYNDEEHTLRTYTRGHFPRLTLETMLEYERSETGLPFKRDGWVNTVWSTTGGPNQVLFSILSRASLSVWQHRHGLPETAFDAAWFRLPSLLAGLGLILVLGALIYRETGMGGGGWAAALLTATHPWLIRYSTEGRGYGLMLLFCALAWWFALGGLRRPGWGSWIGLGLAQWAALNSYIGCVYVPLVLNLTLLPLCAWPLWRLHRRGVKPGNLLDTWHWRRFTRWIIANVLTLALFLPMILPLLPQFRAYFSTSFATAPTPSNWLEDFAAYTLAGVPWQTPEGTNLPSVMQGVRDAEPYAMAAVIAITAFALAGVILLVWRRNLLAWLLPVFLLAPLIGYWHNISGGRILYVWYLIFIVPGILVLAAAGMSPRLWKADLFRRRPWPWLHTAAPVAVLVSGLLTVECYLPTAWMLHDRPKENLEGAIQASGRPVDPTGRTRSPGSIHIACWTNNPFYDPWAITITSEEVIEEAVAYALESGRELELTYGHRPLIEAFQPGVLELMEDHGLFHPASMLPGLEEEQFDIYITQLRRLDPERITRTYRLDPKQLQALLPVETAEPADLPGAVARLGVDLGPEATVTLLPDLSGLIVRTSWTRHCHLRRELAKLRD